jgi:RimJ/RimL family protein N-acetyltransferase
MAGRTHGVHAEPTTFGIKLAGWTFELARDRDRLRRARDAVAADPGGARWGMRLFVAGAPRTLVGFGGFKGPPREGAVELGYAIAPSWEGRGLATAAVRAMLREAFADPAVGSVLAHTRPGPGASARVLEKAGFADEGEVPDEQIGTARRFRRRR